ncbi:hypothetical protein CBR_g16893 [Chara braunii]|uniref:Uncharacterized protein n=1 Tax=Chara braunii TaxID=69332 RepID=A0A388KU02_CHABU|nr:hypothetical protein CBR_g16893 [Chara braunii]|eukprot:GBG73550.1 hypothetical protein CBR_g16893 [Chara braunii]
MRCREACGISQPCRDQVLPTEGCLHVITADTGITINGQLQLMVNAGLNHIPMKALDESVVLEEVELIVDNILATSRCDMELSMEEEREVKKVVMRDAEKRMREYRISHRHIVEEPFNSIAVRSEVEWPTKRFLVCPTDKAPHTPTFVCVNFIRKLALARVSGLDFGQLPGQTSVVAARLKEEANAIAPIGAATDKMPLPHLMVVYKAHKETFRWITNTVGNVLSGVADVCACLLKLLSLDVQALCASKSDAIFEERGVRPNFWWPIVSVGEFMANLPRHVYSVFTGDITRCFETIPTDGSQDGLISAIRFFVQCAMEWRRARTTKDVIAIMVAANDSLHPYWVDSAQCRDRERLYFDEDGIVKACEWLVSNGVVQLGDRVWRQVLGITMGLACFPILCDIYFFKYEFQLISHLADEQDWQALKCFKETNRYIDDLCALNNTLISGFLNNGVPGQDATRKIYPHGFIEVKETMQVKEDGQGIVASFLNVFLSIISTMSGSYATSKHDKKKGLSFPPVRFMKFKSNRSIAQSLQILTAQTV